MHEGETSTKGHYLSLAMRSDGPQEWTLLDDSDATHVAVEDVDSHLSGAKAPRTAAYMLFYKLESTNAAPAPLIPAQVRAEAEAIEAVAVHL